MIGLDGVTFDVINPLIEEGLLPNLAGLIVKGASGRILSTIPPISGPSWISLATGMKPEKTSIYDFTYRKGEDYDLKNISSIDYVGRSIWDYLSKAGKKVGVMNYPMCFPPYEVNGFFSVGLGTPEDKDFTFPGELKKELETIAGGEYERTVDYHKPCYEDAELYLKDVQRVLNKKIKVAKYLMKEKQWDFFWLVISETDWVQHLMWRHIDENHSLHEGEKSRSLYEKFKNLWIRIDRAIGELAEIAGENSNVIVHSDHGFGPNESVFKLNVWLELEGYLVWRKERKKEFIFDKEKLFEHFKALAKATNLNKLAPKLYNYGRATRKKLIQKTIDYIDIDKSIAFDPGHTIPFGGVYINDRIAKTERKKKEISNQIEQKLREFANKNNVKVDIWHKSYSSTKQSNMGPDLIIGMDGWECVVLKDPLNGDVFERRPYSSFHTGSHRIEGIFMAAGPDIRNGQVENLHLWDVAPTVLHLFGMSIPSCIDGHVRADVINNEYMESHPFNIQ
jgi:predicted AlkP superfamily phosphohydrolase/phosphomutase